ncbi:MAG: hypothetical protein Q7R58_02385 [bacterium]|nr:hypothetical protein [bacterium]
MKIVKNISLVLLGIYYTLIVARIVLPLLVQTDLSWGIGFFFGVIILYASPIAIVALILICLSLYLSYKKYAAKPSIIFIIILVILSILPIRFTSQAISSFNQSRNQLRQLSAEMSTIYTDEIPASTSAQLYALNDATQNLIGEDFEPYFTEAKKDGTYYIAIYKRNGKIDYYGEAVRSYLKDPFDRGVIFYPSSYIQFYGSTIGNDNQALGSENCISSVDIELIDIGLGVDKIYEENMGDTTLMLYQRINQQSAAPSTYKASIKKGDSCSVIDFVGMPDSYTVQKIIEISKSIIR